MWFLSDETLEKISQELIELYNRAEKIAHRIDEKWLEMPESVECHACGVDGSRAIERLTGIVLYSVSAVSVGKEIREMSEITTLTPHINIDERVRLHMHTSEFRIGSFAEEELVLIDGSLRGAFIRPPAYTDDPEKLMESYELEALVEDFLAVLEKHFENLEKDLREGKAKKNYLLTREKIFRDMEEGYRKGKGNMEDLMILFEYIEYLHALNKLLDKKAVFVAKSFYTHEFDEKINDIAILQILALKQFGFEKSGYFPFKQGTKKTLPWFVIKYREHFKNLFKDINSAFVRFEDSENIYLVESIQRIEEELIGKLKSLEVHGYPLVLIHAHEHAKIRKIEMRKIIKSLLPLLDSRLDFLLKSGREVLES
ncbi:MAG: DNA double-strand break repair nuclease NurA [Archaeoglobaceae archaeon]|nr:DNA double-strand break repair nuclease NurA [Archaeoglobaceae archaeon]MDW8127957.1 DNA double-strand break repair nuclease NurA [Archaeoglobaceae archaeon]